MNKRHEDRKKQFFNSEVPRTRGALEASKRATSDLVQGIAGRKPARLVRWVEV